MQHEKKHLVEKNRNKIPEQPDSFKLNMTTWLRATSSGITLNARKSLVISRFFSTLKKRKFIA